jgi:hypothetical protein
MLIKDSTAKTQSFDFGLKKISRDDATTRRTQRINYLFNHEGHEAHEEDCSTNEP